MTAASDFHDDRRRRGLPPELVRELSRLHLGRSVAAIGGTLATTGALIAVAIRAPAGWVAPLVIAIALRQHAFFVLVHEAAHYRLFGRRWLNDGVGNVLGSLVGVSLGAYRTTHRLHHNHLYTAHDPDLPLIAGYPRGRSYLLKKLAKDMLGLTAAKNYAYFSRPWVLVVQAGLLYAVGPSYLLWWVLPSLTMLQPVLRFRALCEHAAVADTSSAYTAARTMVVSPWLAWILFPHHVGFHLAHHLHPAIPHYHLPRAHAEMHALGLLRGAEVRTVTEVARLLLRSTLADGATAKR